MLDSFRSNSDSQVVQLILVQTTRKHRSTRTTQIIWESNPHGKKNKKK